MIPCARCGTVVPDGARFCPSCGLSLSPAHREERRIVTILFADLVGFTALSEASDPEVVKRIIDRAFEGLAETVTLYGGTVDKILGDEIMAVFGAPQAHEDDPERAVRCALEMQRALERYSRELSDERGLELAMRVGVNTGEVVAGAIGGGDAYTVVGDAVNVASRLVKAAVPGSVLVGPSTRAATGSRIEYRPLDPLTVKGKAEPVAVAEAVTERARPRGGEGRAAPIVGRDAELSLLAAIADLVARDRRAAAVTIVGDAGMGKTRLVAEFTRRLSDAQVLWGRSLPYGTASASHALEEIVREALGVSPGDDAPAARKRIAERAAALGLAAETDRLAHLAGFREQPVLTGGRRAGGGAGPVAATPARSGEFADAAALFEVLVRSRRLLVLVFQELHWAGAPVASAIGELLDRACDLPLLVVALGRLELAEITSGWPDRPGSTLLHLRPLARDAAADLLRGLAGARELTPAVRDSVLDRAGGNPFFIEEFVRLLTDRGQGDISVPVSVQGVVAARLDALDPGIKSILQDAAVTGEEFWPDALAAIEPHDPDTLRVALDVLVSRELIEPVAGTHLAGRDEYRFRQTIVREVAYASLPKRARAAKHAAVAEWLEAVAGPDADSDHADLVAYHFERAALSAREVGLDDMPHAEKARAYLERAGDRAMGIDAATAAGGFYERALVFARDDEDALQLRVRLGEAYVGSWNPVAAETHLERALADARALGDRMVEGKALRLLGDLARIRGDLGLARPRLEQALQIARDTGNAHEEAEGLRSHGLLDMFDGRILAAPMWFRQALSRARELGDLRAVGWSLQNLGWANLLLGRVDESLSALDEGAEVFGGIGDLEGVGWCMGLRSWGLLFRGQLDEADTLASQLIELAASTEQTSGGMGGMGVQVERVLRAIVAAYRLRFSDALTLASSTLEHFAAGESQWGLAMARYPIAVSHMLRLQIDDARAVLDEAAGHAADSGDPLARGLVDMIRAMTEIEAGELDEAERIARRGAAVTEQAGVGWHSLVLKRWIMAELARRRGDVAGALAILEDPEPLPGSGLFPKGRLRAQHADVLCDAGRPKEAAAMARIAIEEAGPAVVDVASARRILARALLESGEPAVALAAIEDAHAALEGREWDAERVRALALTARILDELGRHDAAGEAYDRAGAILDAFGTDTDVRSLAALLGRGMPAG